MVPMSVMQRESAGPLMYNIKGASYCKSLKIMIMQSVSVEDLWQFLPFPIRKHSRNFSEIAGQKSC